MPWATATATAIPTPPRSRWASIRCARARDSDGDGVPDVVEALAGLDIDAATDTDGDGVPDAREIALGFDPLDANSPAVNGALDDDGDGTSNAIEEVLRLLGVSEDSAGGDDFDGDGIEDADEIRLGTDPLRDEQPVPWIELRQADIGPVNAVLGDGGTASATVVVGGHQSGTLSYDWSASENAILAVVSGSRSGPTLTMEPGTLPAGAYRLEVSVERSAGDYTSPVSTAEFILDVLAAGAADDVRDGDNDGIADAFDTTDGRFGFANELEVQPGARMRAESGLRLQLGTIARIAHGRSARVTQGDIAGAGDGRGGSTGNSADAFDYASGIYDFEVTNLPEVGASVSIVIPQASAIGEFPEYRKHRPETGWTDFVENADNAIATAAGGMGACPPPGDDAYGPGLTPGHFCVQLTIQDGGPNDGDAGLGPNGVVRDPGGVATPQGEVGTGQGGGRVGPAALLALLALLGLGRRRRRR